MKILISSVLAMMVLAACNQTIQEESPRSSSTKYASKFDVTRMGDYHVLRVFNPWQNSGEVTFTYILAKDRESVPDSLSYLPFIRVPVKRVITMSTTHVAMINELGRAESIKGASGTEFIYDPHIRKRTDDGQIREVGYNQGLNYETIISLDPDVLFFYGVQGNVVSSAEKLKDMGMQVVFCADYLENHPLGKAEWIRFFAQFYGLDHEASQLFDQVDSSYQDLVRAVSELESGPAVLTGLPWKDTWYIAGGKSFASRLISDAGGQYLWHDDSSAEATPMDLESVYSRAVNADVWINPGVAGSLEELIRFDERFGLLPVVGNGDVYNNNARMSPGGGNDYWETGTFRPDLILADLISIFHPGLFPDHSMFYYRKLK
jgi:iron complex transport system substrate-binding protein